MQAKTEIYLLVAKKWLPQPSKQALTKLLTKMVENANVIFSKKSDNEGQKHICSVVSISLPGKEKVKAEVELTDAKIDAIIDEVKGRPSLFKEAFSRSMDFEEVRLANGKSITKVDGGYDGDWMPYPGSLSYAGREITGSDFVDACIFRDRIYYKDWSRYYVIDCKSTFPDDSGPVAKEICRSPIKICIQLEILSGKYWVKSESGLLREGKLMLAVKMADSEGIGDFSIFKNYIFVHIREDIYREKKSGVAAAPRFTVYHRKSGARVLEIPEPQSFDDIQLIELKPHLELLVFRDSSFNLHYCLLSGHHASALMMVPIEKTAPVQDYEIKWSGSLKGGMISTYVLWKKPPDFF